MLKLTHSVLSNLKSANKNLSLIRFKSAEARKTLESENQPQNRIVAAAFAALKPLDLEVKTPIVDDKISKASNIDELLSISEGSGVSRRHALKVVSTLAEWSSSGKAKLSDFENDARFVKLCRVLSKGARINRTLASRSEDLSTVLNVTADDEAARLISNLNLAQMVKVMGTLSMRKRRSVLLLRTLAYNITASNEQLDLKQSSDLLYSICGLNFIDTNLLEKICGDVTIELTKDITKSSVIGSIVTSLGLLKYKNCELLDALSEWILQNHTLCRPQDIFSLFVTLATVNYVPSNSEQLFKGLLPLMSESEAPKPLTWLNFVWSLVILNQASPSHISSVLAQDFVNKFEGNVAANIKILNVNATAAHLIENYNGDVLSPLSEVHNLNIVKTKEGTEITGIVVDTLKNLIQAENLLRVNVNTRMGFLIDVECLLDKKCNPLPFDKETEKRSDITRVAIVVYDYYSMCIGKVEPTGANILASRLLEAQGYKVLTVPYTEFKITDKLVHRVQYLENKLKAIVK